MAKKTIAAKPKTKPAAPPADFAAVFARLRAILTPYAPNMIVTKDDEQWYYLDTTAVGPNKRPVGFGAVRVGKQYVSYHFMPIYMNAKLQATISPALKKRQQGKACFNFKSVDETLFAELEALTAAGHTCFAKMGWV